MANNIFTPIIKLFGAKNAVNETSDDLISIEDNSDSTDANLVLGSSNDNEPTAIDAQNDTTVVNDDKLDNEPIGKKCLNNPDIRIKTSIDIDGLGYVVGASLQGRSHIIDGTPCQDYHLFTTISRGWHLSVVSDGAGSAKESERGSKANCEFAAKLISQLISTNKWAENNYLPSDKEWYIEIRNIFEMIQELIKINTSKINAKNEEANINCDPLTSRDFNATLLLILTTPKGMLTAHIGDGRMGYLSKSGEWHSVMVPHKGDEANATVFIPNNWNNQKQVPIFKISDVFLPNTMVIEDQPKAIVLMSDGCERFTWLCTAYNSEINKYYDRNQPYPGFLNPLIDSMSEVADADMRVNQLIDIINTGTSEAIKESDDRTILLNVFNS